MQNTECHLDGNVLYRRCGTRTAQLYIDLPIWRGGRSDFRLSQMSKSTHAAHST
jgi:hypothetical protein